MGDVEILAAPVRFTLDELAARARRPLRAAGVERAIAFGSYARGTADGYSDLDLLVVLDTELPLPERFRELGPLLDALPVTVELLVVTPEEFRRGVTRDRGIFAIVNDEGVTVYER